MMNKVNFLKILVLVISLAFILYKLIFYKDISQFFERFALNLGYNINYLFLTLVLMIVNWLTESYKWKYLVSKLENIVMLKSFKAVLSGITVSIFTPNRVGEFAGRVLFLKKENRIAAVLSTITGNISQVMVTIIFGLISLSILLFHYNLSYNFLFQGRLLQIIVLVMILLIFYIYFNIKILERVLSNTPYLKRFKRFYGILSSYSTPELAFVLLISFFRYAVFVVQFYLMVRFFNIHLSFYHSFISIAAVYIILAIIPTFAFTEISVRSSVSVIVFGIFSDETAGIVFSSVLIWIINLAIPALIGSVFFYKAKL
jgi:uncharacterized membrane protein YbhN (UPF0104 family)